MSIARYEIYDNIGSMYELCSYYDNGVIMNELCSYISCMTFIMIPTLPPPRIYIFRCNDPSPINQICSVSLKCNISEPELWKIVSFFVNWLNYNSKRQLVAKCQTWQLSTTLNSNFQISQASRNYFSELHCIDSKDM